jgi:hypothetical protein
MQPSHLFQLIICVDYQGSYLAFYRKREEKETSFQAIGRGKNPGVPSYNKGRESQRGDKDYCSDWVGMVGIVPKIRSDQESNSFI